MISPIESQLAEEYGYDLDTEGGNLATSYQSGYDGGYYEISIAPMNLLGDEPVEISSMYGSTTEITYNELIEKHDLNDEF